MSTEPLEQSLAEGTAINTGFLSGLRQGFPVPGLQGIQGGWRQEWLCVQRRVTGICVEMEGTIPFRAQPCEGQNVVEERV